MEAEDLLEEPYSFGECRSKTCFAKAKCNAWSTPEHDIKVFIRRSGNFVEILLPEIIYLTTSYSQKDIITLNLNLIDSELDKFLGKTRVGRQFGGFGLDNRVTKEDSNYEIYPCTFTLTKDGKIYIAPSDVCFGFSTHNKCVAGIYPLILSFMADDSEPEIATPEAKKAAT